MMPGRPGSDHGRGGQGGREPRATVQARAAGLGTIRRGAESARNRGRGGD